MEKITKDNPVSQSKDFISENIELLKKLFPQINKEGKIDKTELLSIIGDYFETDDEYYRFTWAGKSMARREANKPTTATLRPDKQSSKDWDTTQNIFIEGDNLEVLKLLQKSYANKIKMIYIDPPYNTGNDFVYKDNYTDNLNNYLSISGQTDTDGKRTSTNSESDGRYHSNWLNMIYPRLRLARNLLKDDGVVFISIDDNEECNLRKLGDEIFGEDNFQMKIIWKKRSTPPNDQIIGTNHDYILVFAKNGNKINLNLKDRTNEQLDRYKNPDNHPKGVWTSGDLMANVKGGRYVASLYFPILNPNTNEEHYPSQNGNWRFSKETIQRLLENNEIHFGEDGKGRPKLKRFLSAVKDGVTYPSIWDFVPLNQTGSMEMTELLGNMNIFDNPKPVGLIKELAKLGSSKQSLILDFFAGSGTTAQATMQLNAEDGGNRKFICVQLPEPTDEKSEAYKAGYKKISNITKERIRRAGEKIKSEQKDDLFKNSEKSLDIGFRAFKLDTSNINAWDGDPVNLEQNLFNAASNIKQDRSEEDVLYEVLLKYGLDLTQKIEEKEIAGKSVFNVGGGALFICLGNNLTTVIAEGIAQWKNELQPAVTRVVFKDTGFTDVEKTNSMQILKRHGITEVQTI